jgi:hypothetical protein
MAWAQGVQRVSVRLAALSPEEGRSLARVVWPEMTCCKSGENEKRASSATEKKEESVARKRGDEPR